MRRSLRSLLAVASMVPLGVIMTSCDATSGDSFDALCAEPLTISCDRTAESTLVVIDADTSDADITAFAHALDAATDTFSGPVSLEARSADAVVLDPEVTPPFSWRIDLADVAPTDLASVLQDILVAAGTPGAVGVSLESGWGAVTIQRIGAFEEIFDTLSQSVFVDGATYTLQSLDERLRVVHLPNRTSAEAIHEIIAIARDYPHAEVLLEAMTSGPQSPTFYVARLSPEEQQEIAARLREPKLADADVDGYPLEFVLGSIGEQGVTYVSGTFGDVAAD